MGKHLANQKPIRKGRLLATGLLTLLLVCVVAFTLRMLTAPQVAQQPEYKAYVETPAVEETPPVTDIPEDNDIVVSLEPIPPQKPQRVLKEEGFYTFLLAATHDNYNTDTLMLGSLDLETGRVEVISIPRDTQVDLPVKHKKINGAYGRDGIEELCREVQEVTGVYPQYYAVVNVKAFTKIVNVLGGVDFYVPYDMIHSHPNEEEYNINLTKGWHTLSAETALQVVRYRGTASSDFGRMELQKDFVLAVLKKVKSSISLTKIPGIVEGVLGSVKTNMPLEDIVYFYNNLVSKLDLQKDVAFYTLPHAGTGKYKGVDYVFLDQQGVLELVNKTVNPYTTDLLPEDVHIIRWQD